MNKPIREGFVREDETADVAEAVRKPKIVYTPKAEPEPVSHETPSEPAKATAAEAPPPLDLDAPPPEVTWPVVLKLLYRPTRDVNNKIIHELTLRAPTAGDLMRCGGAPVRIDSKGDVIVDAERMTQMLAILANVFPPMIEMLDARDWISVLVLHATIFFAERGNVDARPHPRRLPPSAFLRAEPRRVSRHANYGLARPHRQDHPAAPGSGPRAGRRAEEDNDRSTPLPAFGFGYIFGVGGERVRHPPPPCLDHEGHPKPDLPARFRFRNRHGNHDGYDHRDSSVQSERGLRSKPGEPVSPGDAAGSALSLPPVLTLKL